jgi:hypothetical protein
MLGVGGGSGRPDDGGISAVGFFVHRTEFRGGVADRLAALADGRGHPINGDGRQGAGGIPHIVADERARAALSCGLAHRSEGKSALICNGALRLSQ